MTFNGGSPQQRKLPLLLKAESVICLSQQDPFSIESPKSGVSAARLPSLGKVNCRNNPLLRSNSADVCMPHLPQLPSLEEHRAALMHQAGGLVSKIQQNGGTSTRPVLSKLVAKGGYGSVYRGVWRGMDVVVKTVSFYPDPLKNLRDDEDTGATLSQVLMEASICTALDHPNITAVYDHDFYPEASPAPADDWLPSTNDLASPGQAWRLCLIQEYCDGGTMTQLIRSRRIQNIASAEGWTSGMYVLLSLLMDLAVALEYCHEHGVVHGDVNPNNVLLKRDARRAAAATAKLADFGLSVVLEKGQTATSVSRIGTQCYMAPEVRESNITSRSADVYSFGIVMWELFTGEQPWVCDPSDGTYSISNDRGVFRNSLPHQAYQSLCEACMSDKPSCRPSMSVVVSELKELQDLYGVRLQRRLSLQAPHRLAPLR